MRWAQHVPGSILPIIRSVRLRYLQHMVSCCCGEKGDGERQRGTMCTVASHPSFLHFTDNNNEPYMPEENSDKLRKMRNLFQILNKTFANFYSPSEYLAVDEVTVLFKGRIIFQQYILKKQKRLASKFTKHVTRQFTRTI